MLTMRRIRFKKMEMTSCRKIFASYLRQLEIKSEAIDLLWGRVRNMCLCVCTTLFHAQIGVYDRGFTRCELIKEVNTK
jgi:hypothetical protein